MIIRNTIELPADSTGNVSYLGTLYINIKREEWKTEHSFCCLANHPESVKNLMNKELLNWMKEKIEKYCNQREEAYKHVNESLTPEQITALYHIRAQIIKKHSLLDFCQALGYYWKYVETLLPNENSRHANWRSVMKQIWHTCQREIAGNNINSNL